MIPGSSITFMIISAALSLVLPFAIFFIWRKKYDLKMVPLFLGIIAFFIFGEVLRDLIHSIVFNINAEGVERFFAGNPVLLILYLVIISAALHETGRLIAFNVVKSKYEGIGVGLSYGIGNGGISAIIMGYHLVSVITASIMINNGTYITEGNEADFLAGVEAIAAANPAEFLVIGFGNVITLAVQISLSMLVLSAVNKKGKLWLYPVAIILHSLVLLPETLFMTGAIKNMWLVQILLLAAAALTAYISYRFCIEYENKEEETATTTENTTESIETLVENYTTDDDTSEEDI